MQSQLKVFEDIGELLTLQGAEVKGARRVHEEDLAIIKDAILVCREGRIVWIGPRAQFSQKLLEPYGGERTAEFHSLKNRTVMPGFVECHTHTVFAGHRHQEFEWRIQGQTYQEISAKGGGILSTVEKTRQAAPDKLLELAQTRVNQFLKQGVTTLEIKSGYGLDLNTEIKCLEVIRQLQGPDIVSTYLGAHSRSPDFKNVNDYIEFMVEKVLPRVAKTKLADRVDIYLEKGFYDSRTAKNYLKAAQSLGFALTAHVDQLSDGGGAEYILKYSPQSVDHVVFTSKETLTRLAERETTVVLLPTSDFYLKLPYPQARYLLDQGARVALSTDFNPGTSPTQDLSFVGVLARVEMKMTLPEVICALTLGAAWALGRASTIGSLSVKKYCDFVVLDCDWQELCYSVGSHPIAAVYKRGEKKF